MTTSPRSLSSLAACLWMLCAAASANAQIFGAVDSSGAVVLTNLPGDAGMTVVVAAPPTPPLVASAGVGDLTAGLLPEPAAYRALVAEAAKASALNPALLHAVIKIESSYNPRAVSKKGAQGLMQLMPQTSRRLGVADPFSPRDNVMGGARYLRELLDLFDNNLELAVAAYNAGENAVIRAGYRLPPYPETQQYVPKVLAVFRALSKPL